MGKRWKDRDMNELVDVDPKYAKLVEVFLMAYQRASEGKGHQHHSHGEAFEEQWILRGLRRFGLGGGCFQIGKKLEQLENISDEHKINELLDIMNYSAAVIIFLQENIKVTTNGKFGNPTEIHRRRVR